MFIGALYDSSNISFSSFLLHRALFCLGLCIFCLVAGIIRINRFKRAYRQGKITAQQLKTETKNVMKVYVFLTLIMTAMGVVVAIVMIVAQA